MTFFFLDQEVMEGSHKGNKMVFASKLPVVNTGKGNPDVEDSSPNRCVPPIELKAEMFEAICLPPVE